MTRPLRINFQTPCTIVTSRGNSRADSYLDEGEQQTCLDVLGQVCGRMQWSCYTYCLMSNHYHVVLETHEGNLSKGMRQLNGVYTQRFNRRQENKGSGLERQGTGGTSGQWSKHNDASRGTLDLKPVSLE